MISTGTFNLIKIFTVATNLCLPSPISLDPSYRRFVVVTSRIYFQNFALPKWKAVIYATMIIELIVGSVWLESCISQSASMVELFTIACLLCLFALMLLTQHFFITQAPNVAVYLNKILSFNKTFRKAQNYCFFVCAERLKVCQFLQRSDSAWHRLWKMGERNYWWHW